MLRKIALILSLISITTMGYEAWIKVHQPEFNVPMNAVCFNNATSSSDRAYWAVGDYGRVVKIVEASPPDYHYAHQKSTPVGDRYNFTGVAFLSPDSGFIVGYKNQGPSGSDSYERWRGVILRTVDGGETWTPLWPTPPPNIPALVNIPVAFLDVAVSPNYGSQGRVWVSGSNGVVLRSDDGGESWEWYIPAQSAPANPPFDPDDYSWCSDWWWTVWASPDGNICWVGGDNSGAVAYTEDGGAHWTMDFPGWRLPGEDRDTTLVFFDNVGSSQNMALGASWGKVLLTRNGGTSWEVAKGNLGDNQNSCYFFMSI